jgi:uncharacterized DUF497 family protein
MYEWDERKRMANIEKHGLDFADAYRVYENPAKLTLPVSRRNELRLQDIAVVDIDGRLTTLIYVRRNDAVRVISFRRASVKERRQYAQAKG